MSWSCSRLVVLAAAGALLTACSTTEKLRASSDAVTVKEQQESEALKPRYKDIVTGTDVKGQTLTVFVDVNNVDSMDEPAEDAMKADTLATWKRIWTASHPGQHGKLTVVLRDYFGNEVYTQSTRV